MTQPQPADPPPDPPYAELPRTQDVRLPTSWLLYRFRWFGRWGIRRRYRVTLHDTVNVPRTGPVIFASNHVGVLDGPILAIFAPRPVHSLTKHDMFRGFLGWFLPAVGQIPIDRRSSDLSAIKACLAVLRAGRTIGVYPEGSRGPGELEQFRGGAAYLALVSGAPVVPVIMFGTREPGGTANSLPRRGGAIDMVFGPPFSVEATPWPRTREQVEHVSKLLREHMLVHLDQARASTGLTLPGPLPAEQSDAVEAIEAGES